MILVVVGTRPEVIKMAPVVRALEKREMAHETIVVHQSVDLLPAQLHDRGFHAYTQITQDAKSENLTDLTTWALKGLTGVMRHRASRDTLVLVQGDTTTALCGALSAFYHGIPVGHVEAGLRTGNPERPFPEEMNRRLISRLASLHFTPTKQAEGQLRVVERVSGEVYMTGNTIVDELHHLLAQPLGPAAEARLKRFEKGKMVLVTCHRREDLDERLIALIASISLLAERRPDVQIVWPIHPNPKIIERVRFRLRQENIHMLPPLPYSEFLPLLNRADAVITDSGGVIEESVSLNRRVAIIRDETERYEAVASGRACLVRMLGMDHLCEAVSWMLDQSPLSAEVSPYGDGHAGEYIADAIQHWLTTRAL